MNDVMKKRAIGIVVLVIIGVLGPLLLSRWMHDGGDGKGRSAMRVYDITPSGNAKPAGESADQSASGKTSHPKVDGSIDVPGHPDAVSPQSVSQNRQSKAGNSVSSKQAFSTPPVHGNGSQSSAQAAQSGALPQSNTPTSNKAPNARQPTESASRKAGNDGSQTAQRNDNPSGWLVQVASFSDPDNARALVKRLGQQFKASYSTGKVNGKTWYRVNVGPFNAESAARSAAARLEKQGRKPLVRHQS